MESSCASERKDPAEVTPLRVPRSRSREQTSPPLDDSDLEDDNNDTSITDSMWVDDGEVFPRAPATSPTRGVDELANIGMTRLPAPHPSVEHDENRSETPGGEGLTRIPTSVRPKGPKSNADLGGYYFRQVMHLLERKHQDIMFYEDFENHSIMHLDWASEVGNTQENQASRNHNSEEGTGLTSKLEWGKAMFFGDWLYADNGQREYYLEIQIKHVSGDDDEVIRNLGMNPNEVWIGMGWAKDTPAQGGDKRSLSSNSSKMSAVQPKKLLLSSLAGTHSGFPRTSSEERDNEELEDIATLALTKMSRRRPLPTAPTNTSSSANNDHGDAIHKTVHVGSEDIDICNPTATVNSPSGSPWTPLNLSSRIAATSKSEPDVTAGSSTDQAPPSPRPGFAHRFGSRSPQLDSDRPIGTGIPRSKPLVPHSTSFDSIDDQGDTIMGDDIVGGTGDNDGGETYEGDTTQSEIVIPGTPSRSPSPPSSPIKYSPDSDKDQTGESSTSKENQNPRDTRHSLRDSLAPGHDTLNRLCTPELNGSFAARKKRSSIYTVRVVAFSTEHSQNENGFSGPPSSQRHATLLGHGGWVCPPVEERLAKWMADHGHLPLSCSAIPEHEKKQHNNPPQTRCRALPVMFDWSVDDPPRYYGEPAPVWWELGDPCLEDVYWMVWQLLSGKQFIGFKRGTGFGFPRTHTSGDDALLERCPFKSPSGEAGVGSLVKGEEIRLREMRADEEKQEWEGLVNLKGGEE